ncbi:MAG: hypothetical protein EOO59_15350 [Hymenobacter sp.]|nr:MAG: hypothetical protein EOO59_15350 [Hymenobacter sp.]
MSEPPVPPPDKKKSYTWPIAVNLGLLVVVAVLNGADPQVLGVGVLALVVINSVAAIIMGFSGRIHYVVAFVLSALLLLLIGAGICALMLSNMGGMH